jgi:putative ubiquitin-RnfH superfamily antitoxin RatB of RatAB toxin-antitoxin module
MALANPESPLAGLVRVHVVFAPAPRQWQECHLTLPPGATVATALHASGWWQQWALAGRTDIGLAVWNQRATLDTVLRDQDRLELCRDLRVDPKVARRERFQRQGSRASGLFAQRRPGAKPGY